MSIKYNLGCGPDKIEGFINVDHRSECLPDMCMDVFNLYPLPEGHADEILASHVLEHACFDRTVDIVRRWHEVLRPGGILWLAVPNFELMPMHYRNWQEGKISFERFQSRMFGNAEVAKDMYGPGEVMPGIYRYELAFHRAVFTNKLLQYVMNEAGFDICQFIATIPYIAPHPHEIRVKGIK